MTPTDSEPLNSWIVKIMETLIENTTWRSEGDELRDVGDGGLCINTRTGAWYSHSEGKGGYTALSLIALLKNRNNREATARGAAWLRDTKYGSQPRFGSGAFMVERRPPHRAAWHHSVPRWAPQR